MYNMSHFDFLDSILHPSAKFAGGLTVHVRRIRREVLVRGGLITACRLPLAPPELHRTNAPTPRDNIVARQCAPVCDSQGEKERGDDLHRYD